MAAERPLLERGAETEALEQLMADTASGIGGVVVLEGPAGIGKTALVHRATELARQHELSELRATGSELETGFPFGVARQLLEGPLEQLHQTAREQALAGSAGLAGQVLGVDPGRLAETTGVQAAVHALFRLTMNLTRGWPTLITVDDAHWADVTSLQFLHYLARRIADSPIALVVAARPAASAAGPSSLRALLAVDDVHVIRPQPLSTPAMAELAGLAFGTEPAPEFVTSCADATGGNPFLLTELLRALARDGATPSTAAAAQIDQMAPDAVGDRMTGWLASLAEPGAAVVRSLAVLGEAELPLLAQHAGVTVAVAREVCDRLDQAALLDNTEQLRFANALVARAVVSTISAGERSAGHLKAARLLLEAGAPLDAGAVHLLASRPSEDGWVVSVLTRAAAAAHARGAPAEAVGYLQRALAEPPHVQLRAELMLGLGTAQLRLSQTGEAQETLRRGLELERRPEIRSAMANVLSQACFLGGDPDAALDVLEHERETEHDEQRLRVLDGNAISLGLLDPDRSEVMRRRLYGYRQRAESGELSEPNLNALAGAEIVLSAGPGDRGVALVRRAFEAGLTAFDEHTFAYGWAICALDAHDLTDEAIVHIDYAIAEARPRADAATTAYLLSYRTHLVLRSGRLAEAEADGRGAVALMSQVQADASFPLALVDVLVERDRADEASELFERHNPTGTQQRSAMVELVSARVAAALGRREEALAGLLSAGEHLEALAFRHPLFAPWRSLAVPLADELGDRGLAVRLSRELMELADRTGAPTAIALALRVHGCLHDDLVALSRAVQLAAPTTDRLEYARCLAELGAAQAGSGRLQDARETLRSALATAHEAGALALAARARAELIAAGGRPRRAALKGVDALTPTELQVARLAANGLSNRDISDGLFVSLKTVEQHLARCYAKLEISGRNDLAIALGAPTPPPARPEVIQT